MIAALRRRSFPRSVLGTYVPTVNHNAIVCVARFSIHGKPSSSMHLLSLNLLLQCTIFRAPAMSICLREFGYVSSWKLNFSIVLQKKLTLLYMIAIAHISKTHPSSALSRLSTVVSLTF